MTTMDYEAIRRDAHLFLVRPGHVAPDVEDVVRTEDSFLVVRKHDEVSDIVEEPTPGRGSKPSGVERSAQAPSAAPTLTTT